MASLSTSLRHNFISVSPPAKLVLLGLLVLGFMLFGSLLAMVIAMQLYSLDIAQLMGIMNNPSAESLNVIKFFQISQSVFMFILPSIIAAWFFSERTAEYIRIKKVPSAITITLVMLSIASAIPFLNKITELNMQMDLPVSFDRIEKIMKSMEESAGRLTELFLVTQSTSDLIVNFIMIAILPAIGEELLFRGVIQRLFAEWTRNAHVAILITAFLFSFIHFQFYGFLPRFMLGIFFGYLMVWSGSIWVPMAAHLFNNGMAVIYYHFTSQPVGDTTIDTIGRGESSYVIYLSVFLTSLLMATIYLHERSKTEVRH